MNKLNIYLIFALFLVEHISNAVYGEVISLNDNNIGSVLGGSDIAIVNFYADWCRFSQILAPTFEEAGKKVKEELPVPGKVVFAKVDCDRETGIAGRYRINKYPTLKLFRGGNIVKKEYRGQRSVEALVQFAHEQAKDPVHEVTSLDALNEIDGKKPHIIGYFESKTSDNYRLFARAANIMRDDCEFLAAVGPVSENERSGGDRIDYRPPNTKQQDETYTGALNLDSLTQWATNKCTPIVREITFENAEELTEEGLPFVILFHHPDDTESVDTFNRVVQEQLLQEKVNVNFLVADGLKFAHPLHHLGKSTDDLPILAIDSFRHMYLFPHDVKKDLATPGLVKQFIEDLHSGKLHREFHHGPDPTTASPVPEINDESDAQKNIPRDTSDQPQQPIQSKNTSPPESTFKKLAPSRNRYTILRDEL
ncbi:endoplasmic reticulum resident protein 44 [Biomphalaria glabrata]|nr:endoplasmic reticulum resident protein 44-like [Biomphalaria glabrata]